MDYENPLFNSGFGVAEIAAFGFLLVYLLRVRRIFYLVKVNQMTNSG